MKDKQLLQELAIAAASHYHYWHHATQRFLTVENAQSNFILNIVWC